MTCKNLVNTERYNILLGMYGNVVKQRATNDPKYNKHVKAFYKKIDQYHPELQDSLIEDFENHYKGKGRPNATTAVEQRHVDLVHRANTTAMFSWNAARYISFLIYGPRCACCGNDDKVTVDHIKPKSAYPDLATDIRNLQVLCESCNQGKDNWDLTDWRTEDQKLKAIHVMNFPKAIHHYSNVIRENLQ